MNNLLTFVILTKRNILVFLKDKVTVFISLLANIIILGLYLLFLKENYVSILNSALGDLSSLIDDNLVDGFINSYLIAGILGTTCITVSLNSLTVMVRDREVHADLDYKSSPVSKVIVSLAYFTGSLLSTFGIGAIFLTVSLIVLQLSSTLFLTSLGIAKLYFLLFLGCFSANTIMIIVASFFKSASGIGAFGGILSAITGFLIGAYIPITQFSDGIQIFCNSLPASHVAALLRNELLTPILDEMNLALGGIDNGMLTTALMETFAFDLNFFGTMVDVNTMYVYVIITAILFSVISVFVFKKLND